MFSDQLNCFFSSRLLREQEALRVDKLAAHVFVFQLDTIYDYFIEGITSA